MGGNRSNAVRVTCIALASALCVPAAASAAGADYYLKIEGVDGESKDEKHKDEIEILSYSWGATRSGNGQADALTDGLLVLRAADAPAATAAGSGGMGGGKASVNDISVMRGPRQTAATDGVKVAAGDVDGDGRGDAARHGITSPRDVATGQSSGKRTHPALIKISKPLATGSISLDMTLAGCAVGTRYPSARLTTPSGSYALQDVVVAACGADPRGAAPMEQVTLNYARIQVRGWDPRKKEE